MSSSVKVCKFGGTSLADASQIRKVAAIIQNDPHRRYVVPSAPGKRDKNDKKITDLLYLCHAQAQQGVPIDDVFKLVADRYIQIASDLGLKKLDLAPHLDQTKKQIVKQAKATSATSDYAASRGEYLNGLIVAELLGYVFVDAAQIIRFDEAGRFDSEKTQELASAELKKHKHAVIPGFYGAMPDGRVRTFSRGGSDISGAIVARAVNALVYENWTDVNGLLMADPRVVENPKNIETITYRELRELAYMGATVLHDEAIFPVRKAGIPVNIRNTNEPAHPGTMIVKDAAPITHTGAITGLAGRKDFTVIALEKAMMNAEVGFGRKLLQVLEDHAISYEHTPSGIDTMSVVVASSQLESKLNKVLQDIHVRCEPDSLEVHPKMALIATVGRGMAHTPGIAAKVFAALAKAKVNIRMIDQGSSEINIIVGVRNEDFENAMKAIYRQFIE